MKKILYVFLSFVFVIFVGANICFADPLTIALDPGHGESTKGATAVYDGKEVCEYVFNWKVCKAIESWLKNFKTKSGEDVKIILTKSSMEETPGILTRVEVGKDAGANAIISIHFNATSEDTTSQRGSMVLVTGAKDYKAPGCAIDDMYESQEKLGECILEGLESIGINRTEINKSDINVVLPTKNEKTIHYKNGFLRRESETGDKYINGEPADYYGIVRAGLNNGIIAIIVECAYLSNPNDYYDFMGDDEKLQTVAKGVTDGIAKYFDLQKAV